MAGPYDDNEPADGHDDESLCRKITLAVAAYEGVDVTELSEPLYRSINAEALEVLFRDSPGYVTFRYCDHHVTIDHRGNVGVADAETD